MKLKFRNLDEENHEIFGFLEIEGGDLELLQILDKNNKPAPFKKPEIKPPYCPHLALKTDDMEKLVADVKKKGVTVVKGPLEVPGKVKWVYFSDPDNNVIEFIQWVGEII